MSKLLGLALLLAAACVPVEYAEVDAGPQWYYDCSWATPCYYPNDVVFVYGYGMLPRQQYVYYYQYPSYRVRLAARPGWHPRDYPRGHEHGEGRHKEHGRGHGKHGHHGHDDDR